jgi:hypothetical protein
MASIIAPNPTNEPLPVPEKIVNAEIAICNKRTAPIPILKFIDIYPFSRIE